MTMWAKWGFQLPADRLTLSATWASILSPVPSSIHATLIDPNWRRAMEEEFTALIARLHLGPCPSPVGSNVITSKWVFKDKFNPNGTLEWYKAR
jgi:hypothetical protein